MRVKRHWKFEKKQRRHFTCMYIITMSDNYTCRKRNMLYIEKIEAIIADHKHVIDVLERKRKFITEYSFHNDDLNAESLTSADIIGQKLVVQSFERICASNWDIINASELKIVDLLKQLEAKNRKIHVLQDIKNQQEGDTHGKGQMLNIQSNINFEGSTIVKDDDIAAVGKIDTNHNCLDLVNNRTASRNEDENTEDDCVKKKFLDAMSELKVAVAESRSNASLTQSLQAVASEKDSLSQQLQILNDMEEKVQRTKDVPLVALSNSEDQILSLPDELKMERHELAEIRLKYADATHELSESRRELEDLRQRYVALEESLQVVTSAQCSLSLQAGIYETSYERTITDLQAKVEQLRTSHVVACSLDEADGGNGCTIKDSNEAAATTSDGSSALGKDNDSQDIVPTNVRAHHQTASTQTDATLHASIPLLPLVAHTANNHPSQNIPSAISRPSSLNISSSEKVYITPKIRDPDQEALETGILLSQQQAEYGINMLDALRPDDEPLLQQLMQDGLSREEATFIIFRDRYILPAREQVKHDGPQSSDIKIMAMPHLQKSELRSYPSRTSMLGDTDTMETVECFDSYQRGREVRLHRTVSIASNISNSSGGWHEPSNDFDTPVETSRGRSVHLPLTARVLQKKDRGQDYGHARVSSDEGNVNWHHSKLYQTPSSADMSISNRPTPKPVYTHPNSSHRNSFFNDRLLTRQLYQSPAEALHAINRRRKSRELLRPCPSSAGTRGGYFDTEDEYMLSVELLMRKHALSREDATDLYWNRFEDNRSVFSQQF